MTWWQTDDFWRYAAFAAVAYIRIAADELASTRPKSAAALAWTNPRHRDDQGRRPIDLVTAVFLGKQHWFDVGRLTAL